MPKTLLAVDDSATMRKVLEITFGGEDFRVITADGVSAAMARMSEEPVAAVIDTSLAGDDGYALAKELRSRNVRLALVVMASRYSPYDANRGRDAGVDDYIDKPFDTQALIEKVKKAIIARETREVARPAAVAAAPAASSFAQSPRPPTGPTAPAASAAKPNSPVQRTHTLSFEGGLPVVPPPVRNAPAPAAAAPAPHPPASPAAAHPPVPAAFAAPPPYTPPAAITVPVAAHATAPAGPPPAAAHTAPPPTVAARGQAPAGSASNAAASLGVVANGQMAGKLGELGLSAQQVEAVLALSREVVERVVWEIVPQLAEAIIKEEIARLTKEG